MGTEDSSEQSALQCGMTQSSHSDTSLSITNSADTKTAIPSTIDSGWLEQQWNNSLEIVHGGSQSALIDSLTSVARQLCWYKRNCSSEDWIEALALARKHPLHKVLECDPFVADARGSIFPILAQPSLLDFLFGGIRPSRILAKAENLGRRIFGYNSTTKRSKEIRNLRRSLSEAILDAVSANHPARIASVSCGYLRELDLIPWYEQLPIELFMAVARSYEIATRVRRMNLHNNIKCTASKINDIARFGFVLDGFKQQNFDLIYSIGALDASNDMIAEKLIDTLTDSLSPGGRLMLSNSKPMTNDAIFQEVFIGQRPFARNRTDIDYLLRKIRRRRDVRLHVTDSDQDEFFYITVEKYRIC